MPEEIIYQGAKLDTRTEEQKLKDYQFKEIVAEAAPVNWVEKPESQWRKFPLFDQNGSGSCVAQTEAKELGVMRWLKDGVYVHFSATDIYQRRNNKPGSGMAAVDARAIAAQGVTLEILAPSQNMSDPQMDAAVVENYKREVGKVFAVPNWVAIPKDIDTVASIIQKTGKGVMLWFYFLYREWNDVPQVLDSSINLNSDFVCRHSVFGGDAFLYKGKKAILIEDTWGPKGAFGGRRIITEDFFNARNWHASYLTNFRFDNQSEVADPTVQKPKYRFTRVLEFGMTNSDVVALQNILKYEGFFPVNGASTGYYGAITAKAVLAFQRKYKVAPESELASLAGRRVGDKTIAKLNELYS